MFLLAAFCFERADGNRILSEALYTDFCYFLQGPGMKKGNLLCKSYLEIKMSKIEIRPKIMVYCVISV